jgi:hypothetical protein
MGHAIGHQLHFNEKNRFQGQSNNVKIHHEIATSSLMNPFLGGATRLFAELVAIVC